jgi:hypothetical protein
MHQHSLDAYRALDVGTRRAFVLQSYADHGPLTDRAVCASLGYDDMNAVRPRISELVKQGSLVECGTVRDDLTRRMVRTCRLRVEPKQLDLAI